ncbi:AMP-binding protein [Ornithinimicrobium pekingense]|uniref:O-succinylbenzoic acid--CoA ligase n=1 Tax=Ornithinimicrobium pekingense TaxID=384677 RepID=A0ABQ2F721_9MICO|nr:AMP-binding protein [Ornithinimicrobium pekingense]GGK58563.1 O-succinylbenzoic acid--CoA ligase [Ornithinimicrobium pekingense]
MSEGPPDLTVRPGAGWAELSGALGTLLRGGPGGPGAAVLATSGSSGTPKRVRLSGAALRASGEATAQVLGGHGRWLLALPTHHVAGFQVLARSVLAGTVPVPVPTAPGMPFAAGPFAAAVAQLGPGSGLRLASLVPTQLARLVDDASGAGTAALRALDAVLLGGAAADPGLLVRAREAGARVVTTYGMSETCGGCVYDGVPLPGVQVRVDPSDDRIRLGGPVLADGYEGDPVLTAERFPEDADGRWFRTDDRGVWAEGRLSVLGRVDDVIVTGGHKVEPRDVEAALRRLPEVADALVVGVPDPEWGQAVAALVVAAGPGDPPSLEHLRSALAGVLPAHARPRRASWGDAIPLLASGKPDRAAVRAALER